MRRGEEAEPGPTAQHHLGVRLRDPFAIKAGELRANRLDVLS